MDFNKLCWQEVNMYLNLEIGGKRVVCPYFTNHIGMAFMEAMQNGGLDAETVEKIMKVFNERKYPLGWWRGKGTPEQIVEATEEIAASQNVDLTKGSILSIREFMMLHGLGIDCSGFAYNILTRANVNLDEILDFENPDRKGVFKAGAFTFSGKASFIVNFKDIASGDVVTIKNIAGEYTHVALVLADEVGGFKIVQSTATNYPMGIFVDDLGISGSNPVFGFQPELGTDWGVLFGEGRLEFRRLRIMGK